MCKILIISKDAPLCEQLHAILLKGGYTDTRIISEAEEAAEAYAAYCPNLVIYDLDIPQTEKEAFVKAAQNALPHTVAVIASTTATDSSILMVIRDGVRHVIARKLKPFLVLRTVQQALQNSG